MKKILVVSLTTLLAMLIILTGCSRSGVSSPSPARPAPAVKLVFTAQPSQATADLPFNPQPVVAAVDEQGNIATGYRGIVVLTITASTGHSEAHLFGGARAVLMNGVVEFRGLYIDKAGPGYTLTATCSNLAPATSQPFTISPGAPARLVFTIQPSGGVAGSPFTTPPEVTVQDEGGNVVTGYEGSVTLAITYASGPHGAVVSGATTPVVNGIARFTSLSIDKTNLNYTLTAVSDTLVSATSRTFNISPAAPTKLGFTIQPAGARAGKPFETQPKVAVEDRYGNVVTSSRASITLLITPGTGTAGAVLSGTKTLIAEDALGGLTEFTDLSIDLAGAGYTLTATSSGLTPGLSDTFGVSNP